MKVPAQVLSAAAENVAEFGAHFGNLGEYNGRTVYVFRFPKGELTGFPFLYLYSGKDGAVETVTGFDALDIIRSLGVE